ncbi:hypothetical protein BOTBODRAFT_515817 [Botryobasidium botryosum FD-172 SS1]|uniref:Uncharacterized protein n=1 Tax=Botryobasidium botryosum (strain FD-172 SS1) TaxID=930990 RepID=A0A067MS55_BOTB1|nr:hypothetical protein BOTBODRAFT_515817 [Botryobasidium botryosum FD-172 SS1]
MFSYYFNLNDGPYPTYTFIPTKSLSRSFVVVLLHPFLFRLSPHPHVQSPPHISPTSFPSNPTTAVLYSFLWLVVSIFYWVPRRNSLPHSIFTLLLTLST